MGVYNSVELEKFSVSQLMKMWHAHKNDLREYELSESYPNRERDISETKQNIKILDEVIENKS